MGLQEELKNFCICMQGDRLRMNQGVGYFLCFALDRFSEQELEIKNNLYPLFVLGGLSPFILFCKLVS